MSKINVDTWEPESGTALTMGASGDTTTVPSGASLVVASGATINITGATQTGFPSAGFAGVSKYAADATWTKATRESALGVTLTKVIVEVQAGGGGGSSGNGTQWGGNGGGGSYVKQFIDVSSITSSTIVVGAAGTGGTSATTGGTSSWTDGTNTISCLGGVQGEYAASGHNDGGVGGVATASGATLLINGQNGTATYSDGGQGGDSGLGFGGQYYKYSGGTGALSTGYGGGGGGGTGTSAVGVDGGAGIVLVWEFG